MMKYSLHKAALASDLDGAALAIQNGADLNELDDSGDSALHWAVLRGDIEMVKLLLEAGADPNGISTEGFTPKWSAVDFGLVEIIDILTAFKGKVLTNNDFDKTSWSVFKDALGESLPKEDVLKEVKNTSRIVYLHTCLGIVLSVVSLIALWTVLGLVSATMLPTTFAFQEFFFIICCLLPILIVGFFNIFMARRNYKAQNLPYYRSYVTIAIVSVLFYGVMALLMSKMQC